MPTLPTLPTRSVVALAAVALTFGSPAIAQVAGPRPMQHREHAMPNLAMAAPSALQMAYDAIGRAQAIDAASPSVASAKSHYTAGLARFAKNDAAGAFGEAHAAMAYARLALDAHGSSAPSGIAAPPPSVGGDTNRDASHAYELLAQVSRSKAALGKVGAIAASAEATSLLAAASAAETAAERAASARNYGEAERQGRLAMGIGHTLVAVASIDHATEVRAAMPDFGPPGGMGFGGPRWGMHGGRPPAPPRG